VNVELIKKKIHTFRSLLFVTLSQTESSSSNYFTNLRSERGFPVNNWACFRAW